MRIVNLLFSLLTKIDFAVERIPSFLKGFKLEDQEHTIPEENSLLWSGLYKHVQHVQDQIYLLVTASLSSDILL